MKAIKISILAGAMMAIGSCAVANAAPPFWGTIFLDPDIITDSDPTTFVSLSDAGRGARLMFDRRVNDWVYLDAYLFMALFDDGLGIEIQVNPEFGDAASARAQASKYAPIIGRLPSCLRADVQTVWIHLGNELFGGGNNNLLIHTGQADLYNAEGILEETLVHEASHTSLDAAHAGAPGWLAAQSADGEFISTYARDHPTREDIAESFLLYLALRYRADRISQSLKDTISRTIPNRISYFDGQPFDLFPLVPPGPFVVRSLSPVPEGWRLSWNSRQARSYSVFVSGNLRDWRVIGSPVKSQGSITTQRLDRASHNIPLNNAFFRVREIPLQAPEFADMSTLPLQKVAGYYQRDPVLNGWHKVNITLVDGALRWTNDAGVSWGLEVIGADLWTSMSSPYGANRLRVEIDVNGQVVAVHFLNEPYRRTEAP